MPCIPIPKAPLPSLPPGLTLSVPLPKPPLPSASAIQTPCCLLPPFTPPNIPVSIPIGILGPGISTALRQALAAIEAYTDALPLTCPRS